MFNFCYPLHVILPLKFANHMSEHRNVTARSLDAQLRFSQVHLGELYIILRFRMMLCWGRIMTALISLQNLIHPTLIIYTA